MQTHTVVRGVIIDCHNKAYEGFALEANQFRVPETHHMLFSHDKLQRSTTLLELSNREDPHCTPFQKNCWQLIKHWREYF